jgi:hypothetical protein
MQFGQDGVGLTGSVVGSLFTGGSAPAGGAAAPAATSGPTGRPTLMAAAWGTDNAGSSNAGMIAALTGLAAWAGLIYLWWVLPK